MRVAESITVTAPAGAAPSNTTGSSTTGQTSVTVGTPPTPGQLSSQVGGGGTTTATVPGTKTKVTAPKRLSRGKGGKAKTLPIRIEAGKPGTVNLVFKRNGIGPIEEWEPLEAPARRRRWFHDGGGTLAVLLASASDLDDLIASSRTAERDARLADARAGTPEERL